MKVRGVGGDRVRKGRESGGMDIHRERERKRERGRALVHYKCCASLCWRRRGVVLSFVSQTKQIELLMAWASSNGMHKYSQHLCVCVHAIQAAGILFFLFFFFILVFNHCFMLLSSLYSSSPSLSLSLSIFPFIFRNL